MNRPPSETQFAIAMTEIDRVDPEMYHAIDLDSVLLGMCIGNGMTVSEAVKFVAANPVGDNR